VGATDRGTQTIVHQYFEDAVASQWGKRHKDIRPRGIYSGGYLTRVDDDEVTLSSLVVEIGDTTLQISVRTASAYALKTANLDSGSIAPATPYIVLRWSYVATPANYMEIRAIASVAAAQANDIIVGKCVFEGSTLTGFDYADRTFLNVQNLFLKVEPSEAVEMYVMVRAGRIQNTTGYVSIADQKVGPFSVPGGSNSRIDLVYVDTDGTVKILQGTAAVSPPPVPSYGGKLVLAEVRLDNGDVHILAAKITDVRAFIAYPLSTPVVSGIFGSWADKSNNIVYQAVTDGYVVCYATSGNPCIVTILTDASNPPTTVRQRSYGYVDWGGSLGSVSCPVRKGDYWKVTGATTVYWMPVGT
jgi:hypothetical protein